MVRSPEPPRALRVLGRRLPEGVREEGLMDEPFSFFRAVQQIALAAVLEPDQDAMLRRIQRWYSRQFSTPLHRVQGLPLLDVLTAFYEDRYESMSAEERETVRVSLAQTASERLARRIQEAEEEIGDEEYLAELEAMESAKADARQAAGTPPPPPAEEPEPPGVSMRFARLSPGDFAEHLASMGSVGEKL